MRPADTRLQSIGATFAVRYYTTLVKSPEQLVDLYTASANVVHRYRKANGAAEVSSLLLSLTAEGMTEVKVVELMTTPTTSGAIKVAVTGQFVNGNKAQPFTQELELRELEKNVFGITSDKLSYSAAGQMEWAAPTPVLAASAAPTAVVPTVADAAAAAAAAPPAPEKEEEATAVDAPADAAAEPTAAAAAAAATSATAAADGAADAPAAPAAKRPASFAEALRQKKQGDGAAFSNTVVRVTDKVKGAEEKKDKSTAAAAAASNGARREPRSTGAGAAAAAAAGAGAGAAAGSASSTKAKAAKRLHGASSAVVYYDIILKELAETTTEEEVRAVVSPVAPVTLVNIVKSEKRRRGKEETSETITFAFVQLERGADAPESLVKDTLAKLAEMHREMHIEEVRERRPPARRPDAAAAPHRAREGHTAAAASAAPSRRETRA
ncbi:hypothetical protein NESM_000570800 [Novymonas esmeraldas]|uniref:NTF2 domain-containing protein n=1 Tax=Novymonas esmeraldas TaxID=1808958 RepID=A0AAW0EQ84_9TRYP